MYEIIIVGGGPAGAIAGKLLASAGKKVLLFQQDFDFKKPCGGGIRFDAFDEFGIDKSIIKKTVNEIVLQSKTKKIEFNISDTPLAIVDRTEFDKALRYNAQIAGTEILEAKVTDVKVLDSFVEVYVKTDQKVKKYTAKYLIAADGVLSTVRKKVKNEEVSKVLTHYTDIADLKTEKCYFYFGKDLSYHAYAWRFPYHDGTDIGVFTPSGSKKYINNFLHFLHITQKPKIKGYFIPLWQKTLFYDNKVFYTGDAASLVMPFTFEGIYYAMKSAKIVSDVINEDVDFREYEKRWNSLYDKKFKILKYLQEFFLKSDLTISLMMKLLTNPAVKQKVLLLWLDQYELKIDKMFFLKIAQKIIKCSS